MCGTWIVVASGLAHVRSVVPVTISKVAATASWPKGDGLPPTTGHAKEIGVGFLASDGYVVAFELAAVLLTVALVAAVYIARRRAADFEESAEGGSY